MKKSDYKIGSVVLVKLKQNPTVIPAVIVEKHFIETLDGSKYTYKFRTKSGKVNDLPSDAILFESIEELSEHLTEQITTAVAKMVENAQKQLREFQNTPKENEQTDQSQQKELIEESSVKSIEKVITAPNGQTIRVKLPVEPLEK